MSDELDKAIAITEGDPINGIPDSRVHDRDRFSFCGPVGIMSKVYCSSCGELGGAVTEEWASTVKYLCEDCGAKYGHLAGLQLSEETVGFIPNLKQKRIIRHSGKNDLCQVFLNGQELTTSNWEIPILQIEGEQDFDLDEQRPASFDVPLRTSPLLGKSLIVRIGGSYEAECRVLFEANRNADPRKIVIKVTSGRVLDFEEICKWPESTTN